ncbi:NADP-dependent oxidoreductase domain-containing protein [Cercophora newfieldiana]|uniref:NADP-dependent oxidoreductase domain-containing protein n=1 Tax=Cercophora newfieldiana TaxID=92897 RepID=A0AA39XXJ1_9PEZI|nr:NADP-dependent oxidoreductase domain-containing protein [Cercophora newfieldiana]
MATTSQHPSIFTRTHPNWNPTHLNPSIQTMPSTPLPATGLGLLGYTWRPNPPPDSQAFPAMKAAIARGATIWSTSSIYGLPPNPPTAGLHLLRRYFTTYPEDAPKVTLFIRGCFDAASFTPTCTPEGVLASWEECNSILGGVKKIDVFGPARMDQNVPVEVTIGALKKLKDEGKIGAVGLSEVRSETIRRASAVCPIAFAEVEFSLWSREILENGVALAAKECGVVLLSYAPLGYGFLVGGIKKVEDLPEGDGRLNLGRFKPENLERNVELAEKVQAFASRKGATPAQVALAWIRSYSNKGDCGEIIPIPGATKAERVEENCEVIELTVEEREELDRMVESFEVVGHRHIPGADHFIWT